MHAHLRLLLAGARAIREARVSSKKRSLKQAVGNDVWEGLGGEEGEQFIARVEQTQMYSNYHHSQIYHRAPEHCYVIYQLCYLM